VSQRPCLASTKTPVAKIKSPKTKPAENIDGFVSGLKAAFGPPFLLVPALAVDRVQPN